MSKVLYNVTWPGTPPTLEQVRERLGLSPDDLDSSFGVIAVTPEEGIYAILVDERAIERLSGESAGDKRAEGPFSNPRIEPFGPPS